MIYSQSLACGSPPPPSLIGRPGSEPSKASCPSGISPAAISDGELSWRKRIDDTSVQVSSKVSSANGYRFGESSDDRWYTNGLQYCEVRQEQVISNLYCPLVTDDARWSDNMCNGSFSSVESGIWFSAHTYNADIDITSQKTGFPETGPLSSTWPSKQSGRSIVQDGCQCEMSLMQAPTEMDNASGLPSIDSTLFILQKCREEQSLALLQHVHIHICSNGLADIAAIRDQLVPTFVKCGGVAQAHQLFHGLVHKNEHAWTSLLSGYIHGKCWQHAFDLYQEMQDHFVVTSNYTCLALLRACAYIKAVDRGRDLHDQAIQMGFERDLFVGSSFVDMYAKCGFLSEAQKVLDKLPVRNVVAWTALIGGYVEYGACEGALDCYEQMRYDGVSPNAVTFACVLKACSRVGALEKGRAIHRHILKEGFGKNTLVGNSLISMYAKCGSLAEARKVFYTLPFRDVVSWNSFITACTELGAEQEVLNLFDQMKSVVVLNAVTYACVLKACGVAGNVTKGQEIHTQIYTSGFEKDFSIGNTLVAMYAKFGMLSDARQVFFKLSSHSVVSWTALITGYAEHGYDAEALLFFEEMQHAGIFSDPVLFGYILKVCSNLGLVDRASLLHREIVQEGFEKDVGVSNALIGAYAKCGLFLEGLDVFNELHTQDVSSWTALLAAYAEHGPTHEALKCFEIMQSKLVPLDCISFSCILKACGNIGALWKGREIHKEAKRLGFEIDKAVCHALIGMYANCGSLLEAQEVFNGMMVRDVEAWSALIKAYGRNHGGDIAVQCFENMLEHGVTPDAVAFTCLLTACSHSSLISKGLKYFKLMKEGFGVTPTLEHYNCMVDTFARSGCLYEAERFLEMLCLDSPETWAALLTACKVYGETGLGLRCFQKLVQKNPEVAAWYALMTDAYVYAGRLNDAHNIEDLRRCFGAKKKPARALIEVKCEVHEFVVGEKPSNDILTKLNYLNAYLRAEGDVRSVTKSVRAEANKLTSCEHAEKLALAFGLLNTPQGETLRVTKNLRMCSDCHNSSKAISKIEKREIILRDDCCIHHFKAGVCSCGDMF